MSTGLHVASLFSTPVVTLDVADATALNTALRAVIEHREKTNPGTQHSNLGGWQSDWEMERWGGAPAIKLLAVGRNTANRVTTDRAGQPVAVTWRANMWANINRAGHGNEFHSHPGSFWSGVYYVDDGGIDADPALGGELEFMDPRGPGPAMYAPHLAYGKAGL
ncbi:MAG TPA: putative 2OG-Fe(II) oxygenase, partial [Reyranella sp.]|nr:putative 2OG-Fe(II) oxygenase [Reyranella sp.]